MKVGRARRLAAAATLAVAVAGCGLGEGERTEGEATLTVTRDYGAEPMVEATVSDPSESETVIRFLDREADITTRYGGGFVQSIDGVAGAYEDGRNYDWFFYVDGIESPVGSAEREVSAGQRIWWDYRDWTDAMRVPAVVGSWPEPFVHSAAEDALPVRVECHAAASTCDAVEGRLADEGISPETGGGDEALRVVVGPWSGIRADGAAALLAERPSTSGVFARFFGDRLVVLDVHAREAAAYANGAGLVAAVRDGEHPPTWLVTGTGETGVAAAAELLDAEHLADRYAVATTGAEVVPLPVR